MYPFPGATPGYRKSRRSPISSREEGAGLPSDETPTASGSRAGPLKGRPTDEAAPQEKLAGWHWTEWASELVGTAFQLFLGFTLVALFEAPYAPGRVVIPSAGWRLVVIGACFEVLAAIVAISPVGKRSGAHLNPAVTFGFFLRKHTHLVDLTGYTVGQLGGALIAAAALQWVWDRWSGQIDNARTSPGPGTSAWEAVGIEAGLTMALLLVVFNMVSSPRTARWTPPPSRGY
jgi:aquaporin Z